MEERQPVAVAAGGGSYTRRSLSAQRISRNGSAFGRSDSLEAPPSPRRDSKCQNKHEIIANRQSSQDKLPTTPKISFAQNNFRDHYFKVMLLGDSGVGKTCLLTRFRDGRFLAGNYITTVGIDFRNKIIEVDGSKVKLQIWDTAGQERFRSVTHAYYRDAHALLLLYDVTNKMSFDNIRAWLGEIREYAHDDVVIMLLGNKCDCGNERIVRREDGERLAREHNVPFMETSAKTGVNVELAFFAVARHLTSKKSEDLDTAKFNVQDYVREHTKKQSCINHNCLTT